MPDRSLSFWLMGWLFEPSIILGLGVLYGGYLLIATRLRDRFAGSQPLTQGQLAAFTSGVLVLAIALLSPLDTLGDDYWFSAHMVQHLLLTLVAPPLLLVGTPGWMFDPLRRHRTTLTLARFLGNAYTGFIVFNFVFAIWHVPTLYDAALYAEPIHILEHLMFIATALMTWMPILSPTPLIPRLAPAVQVLYLFLQSVPGTVLGAVISFAPDPLYTFYASAPRLFGVSVMADQLYGGLIMWVGAALVWLLALTIVFFKWFNREEPLEGQGFI
jgi:putative membrane protein